MENEGLEDKLKCIWKEASESDERKSAEGNKCTTFSKDKECYKCDGYNVNCETYLDLLKLHSPDKVRVEKNKELNFLVVDDQKGPRNALRALLEGVYPNCQIYYAENGKELLKYALEVKPNLIITDYNMPIMNGLDATKKLREMRNQTPVIFTSGTPDEDLIRYVDNPTNNISFLQKPYDVSALETKVAKHLKK